MEKRLREGSERNIVCRWLDCPLKSPSPFVVTEKENFEDAVQVPSGKFFSTNEVFTKKHKKQYSNIPNVNKHRRDPSILNYEFPTH
jgi:hypothetical protein